VALLARILELEDFKIFEVFEVDARAPWKVRMTSTSVRKLLASFLIRHRRAGQAIPAR
jgi:hypothetical protein